MTTRHGDWIQTYSLGQFWPLDPRPEEVRLIDIAHALSMMCRFTGHVHQFYSVAEHCVRVSWLAGALSRSGTKSDDTALLVAQWGLLHDASEAYLVDLARPIKRTPEMAPYRDAEERIMRAIAVRFALAGAEPKAVKEADQVLLYTEARDLFPGVHPDWRWYATPLETRIVPWTQQEAKARFIARFVELWPDANLVGYGVKP